MEYRKYRNICWEENRPRDFFLFNFFRSLSKYFSDSVYDFINLFFMNFCMWFSVSNLLIYFFQKPSEIFYFIRFFRRKTVVFFLIFKSHQLFSFIFFDSASCDYLLIKDIVLGVIGQFFLQSKLYSRLWCFSSSVSLSRYLVNTNFLTSSYI